ncbi:HAD-IA family hydrolase [Methylovirgula sp. 4M-Z18]|uniref:HAD-IA family hydrolase n=1 Tax=Methylovirgula sp. 4M-Z18 TaxID=2293567 RepID=UPI000E2E5A61|nr:HAD-IA family hydrolase [Methylovirgula sp. 4M-Z18]RFB79957.1 hypothetical protein DYH55_10140 [Methylovirgula sp. 4M-Z18]
MANALKDFKYLSFDVVGTLIDFEGGLTRSFAEIGREHGVELDGEHALSLYRQARYSENADLFPDDLVRVYLAIAPQLGLPAERAYGEKLRDDVRHWQAFPDSVEALANLGKHYKLIAMTNARRWAFELFEKELGNPFYQSFTADDTGTEKPDRAFFEQVFAFVEGEGGAKADILHVAQSQYHDIGISRRLGMTNCWIERRHAQKGYGGTIEPAEFAKPDYHFMSMSALSDATDEAAID